MDEPQTELERRVTTALRAHADRPELRWAPAAVVADVTRRPKRSGWWPDRRLLPVGAAAAALALLVVVAVVGPRLGDDAASSPSMARVNGVDYYVGVARSLVVDDDDLSPFGEIQWTSYGAEFSDPAVLRLRGVDPDEALVARARPGLRDDYGPYGEYLILWGPDGSGSPRAGGAPVSRALCGYFDPNRAASPAECRVTAVDPTANADAQATPAPQADLAGVFVGGAQLEGGCAWVVDDNQKSWEVLWPEGYRVEFEGDAPLLVSPDGAVVARSGDRIGVNGSANAFVDGELIVKFSVAALDPVAAERGSDVPRRPIRDEWAAANGLAEWSEVLGFVNYRITDGTPTLDKLAELEQLPEVSSVTTNIIGSFCMVGELFRATEIVFAEPSSG